MRILFISSSQMIATHLAYRMKQEGNEVKLFIDDVDRIENFENLVPKTNNWKKELKWVGKGPDSLIVFDDVGYGKIQDDLRKNGYSVLGGSEFADKLESDRQYAHEIFNKAGIKTVPTKNFNDVKSAISFVKKNKGVWVIKQNGHASKGLNYVGQFQDGSDVINVLENYMGTFGNKLGTITLQQKVNGMEIGVARYFNGNDWVGPIEINIEHKRFFTGDLGPMTSEMGTVAWYDDNENNKLFQETLAKLKSHLKEIDFKGDIDIGCIVNESGAYPLEASPRLGSPIIYLHAELNLSPWSYFLKAIADGKNYDLKWKKGYGLVLLLAVPPFPYAYKIKENTLKGINIYFDSSLSNGDFKHIYFEGVALSIEKNNKQHYISDHQGYVLYITSVEESVELAREKVNNIVKHIYIPKMFYRNDIGLNFINEARNKLKLLGYI